MYSTHNTIESIMKYLVVLLLSTVLFSCGEEKVILLPEIETANSTEVRDISVAYLFYDETKPDSVELNRKNLISTTNWLVNVDKRLSLAQAIPKIKLLQDKKRDATMHTNKNAKNYYSCNDTSIESLGFLEFTQVNYIERDEPISKDSASPKLHIKFKSLEHVKIINAFEPAMVMKGSKNTFIKTIKSFKGDHPIEVVLHFNKNLSFQDYITLKSKIETLDSKNNFVSTTEFIY